LGPGGAYVAAGGDVVCCVGEVDIAPFSGVEAGGVVVGGLEAQPAALPMITRTASTAITIFDTTSLLE
jgi:hypothetical protein